MFEQVVFAGGGHRCWWQAGFWEVVAPAIALRPRLIAGVSAGAATACLLYANDARTALDYYREALAGNRRNVYPATMYLTTPLEVGSLLACPPIKTSR